MIFWALKQLKSIRQAIAGRQHPSQLAWGVAFGLILGIVPHGNLLAIALLLVVLSLKLNHAMAGLTAVAVTFAATHLDPLSDQIGHRLLTHPEIVPVAASAWRYPLVPWTDLNNTVVLGSFIIGLAAILPTFLITYPVFRLLAPKPQPSNPTDPSDPAERWAAPSTENESSERCVVQVDGGRQQEVRSHRVSQPQPGAEPAADQPGQDHDTDSPESWTTSEEAGIPVETRIDVIRMTDFRESADTTQNPQNSSNADPAMDEALTYLLRQLRDSQHKDAA